uniref:EF-hand domain-containing protein n=1 Tax=Denticeps clupeoides TaxID=299321 RepID=A0AAY4A094_9TELE
MDETQQDLYEERLKEVFRSFDASGVGSLSPEELVELCQALQLQEAAPTLLHGLLQEQDSLTGRVDFEQFKNALILVLSSSSSSSSTSEPQENQETSFVKGGKRYGRRSTPEFIESVTDFTATIAEKEGERWNSHDSSTEEYEAEGQLHLWNPDEPGTPRGTRMPLRERVEERLHAACTDLALPWDAPVTKQQLLLLCQHADMEVTEEQWQWVDEQGEMSVSEFTVLFSRSQPPTPSSSTPYRQLKRHHSTQPFDESGRRISVVTSTLGLRLFSALDDGTGHTPAEYLLDAWIDEGIDNSPEILQALDFSLEGKVNLSELTLALENELLMTKNGIHQAALASFKAEIRHLLERVDRELREKDKIRSDLEKAEKLKSQLASEVDEHHSAIERLNDINLRKLKQDHKERFSALRLELTQEMDRLQQQANQQREELEAEVKKAREDETFLRERLALTAKENGRLEAELLDSTEKLVEAENQASKLQESLDNVLKEKFGDLDPDSSEFFLQEDRLCRLRRNYEEQCRVRLQDRIDELQAELEEYRVVGRMAPPPSVPSLSEELNSKSPGIESDQGLGSEEGQPFNMSLEAEMLLEQAKEHHLKDIETVQSQVGPPSFVKSAHRFEQNFAIIQELHESQGQAADLEEQLKALKVQHAEMEEMERQHAEKINRLQQKQDESVQSRLEEQRERLQTMIESEKRLREEWKQDRRHMEQSHEEVLHTRLEKVKVQFEEQRLELERRLNEQRELECLFSQRIKEVEDRFSSDQDSISERFQADIQSVEQHYQSKLQSISDHHNMEKAKWESEVEAASQEANEQCLFLQERLEEEKALVQELSKEREWLESAHKEEINSLKAKNQELQNELESFTNAAQTKEIELIRQLNELHDRLQENLDAKDELVTKSEKAAKEMSMLLQQAANDFEQERAELKASLSDLNERQNALLSLADQQMEEKRGLLEERERLSAKAQEMEQLLHQAVEDFKNERLEMQFSIAELEEKCQKLTEQWHPEQNIREIKEIKPKDIAEMCLDITNTGTEVMFADDVDVSEAFRVNGPSKEEVLESETNQVQIRKKEVEQKCHVQADIQEVLALQACVDQLQGWTQLLTELQPQYDTAILNNQAMKHQVSTLQQHNRELDYNNENIVTAKQARVENCKLKSEIFTMVEQAKALEVKEFELTDLQIRYEECICENVRLNECNERLEKRVLSLESKMHIIQEFHDQHATLLDEIGRMRQENAKLIAVVHEMEGQDDEVLSAMQQEDGHATGTADAETFLDLNLQLEAKIQAVSDLEDCCTEFERQNAKLRGEASPERGTGPKCGEGRIFTNCDLYCFFFFCFFFYSVLFCSCLKQVAKLGATESQVTQLRQERQAAERQTQGLRSQLSKAQEKFHTLDGTLQVVNLQNSRLKSDLRVAQQEKDALKQEVMSMHQKLQNANDKVSLQASGFPSVQRQLLSAELSRLLEQDHQLLAQENSRLLCELQHAKGELLHTREKACQLELSLVTLKQRQQQQGQTGLLKTLEQDKTSLKRELESLRSELHSVQKKVNTHFHILYLER